MRRIRQTEASDEFVSAIQHIQKDNPTASRNIASTVIESIDKLIASPGLGRLSEVKRTRELVCPPYVVVYRSTDELVETLHVWHGAQDWK